MTSSSHWPKPYRPPLTGYRHVVVSGHHMASQAGMVMLENGGNAIDAAVATALANNVLQLDLTGIAGVAPALIYLKEQDRVVQVIGNGVLPKAATCAYFQEKHGGRIPLGVLESMVPAAIDTYVTCLARFGTMSFAEVAAPAIALARDGFPAYRTMLEILQENTPPWPSTQAIIKPGGRFPAVDDLFRQEDLGRTLQFLADQEKASASRGREAGLEAVHEAFYRGDIARTIDAYYRAEGGLLRFEDLAAYRGGVNEPVKSTFRGLDVYAGQLNGTHLLEALNILETFDLEALGFNSAAYAHAVLEAFNLAYSDREHYIGDPDFVRVPFEALHSKAFARERARLIDSARAFGDMPAPGPIDGFAPYGGAGEGGIETPLRRAQQDGGTSYLCTMDKAGNAVSMMISSGHMSAPVVPGTGFAIAHFGICGWTDPRHPNAIAPGKRLRLSGPAMAIRPGEMVMPIGTPGSDVIAQAIAQVLINIEVFGMDVQLAVEQPRFASYSFPALFFPHGFVPGQVKVEESLAARIGSDLEGLGHRLEVWPERHWRSASMCLIRRDLRTGLMSGAADPRRDAYALGW